MGPGVSLLVVHVGVSKAIGLGQELGLGWVPVFGMGLGWVPVLGMVEVRKPDQ